MADDSTLRKAALAAMDRFADKHDVTNRCWTETEEDGVVTFHGFTDGGREFAMSYERQRQSPP